MEDANSQVISASGSVSDEFIDITFTIPCWSNDTSDISIADMPFLLFSHGAVVNSDPTFHGLNKWFTSERVGTNCGGEDL